MAFVIVLSNALAINKAKAKKHNLPSFLQF